MKDLRSAWKGFWEGLDEESGQVIRGPKLKCRGRKARNRKKSQNRGGSVLEIHQQLNVSFGNAGMWIKDNDSKARYMWSMGIKLEMSRKFNKREMVANFMNMVSNDKSNMESMPVGQKGDEKVFNEVAEL